MRDAISFPASSRTRPSRCSTSFERVVALRTERDDTERVYDLTVDGAHCFFANGLLVHNCHHAVADGIYARVLDHLAACPLVLGVTATPERADRKQLGEMWQEVVYQRGIEEMIRDGYLCDLRGVRIQLAVDLSKVKVSAGDFQADQLGEALEEASAPRHVLAAYQEHAAGRTALLFTPTVALAHHMAQVFTTAGVPAEALDGTTAPGERVDILDRLRGGATKVVCNVAVLAEGVDLPNVDCVICAAPTKSRIRYSQQVGRGLRPYPGKENCLVIDLAGASDKLDLQSLPRLFNLREQPAPDVAVTDALAAQADTDRQHREAEAERDGKLAAREVKLIKGRDRRLRWLRRDGRWLLSVGSGGMLALVPDGERWTVMRLGRERGDHERLADGVDLGYAHGIAEDHVRRAGAWALVDPSARWRKAPMTPAQVGMLDRLGVEIPEGATKGAASDLIAVAQGSKRLDVLASVGA